ncbi:hypothetical protein DL771_000579 [Monosporascus sp. 5C6A]|nr:hypothetical protein DL771_000579 [Monosporascus sp. 5C6A]
MGGTPVQTPPPGKYEWLVVVPDKPGQQQKRLEVRSQHFAGLNKYIESGLFKTGVLPDPPGFRHQEREELMIYLTRTGNKGAVLNSKPESDDDPTKFDFYGSTIIVVAESREEVVGILEKDIYATSGVWDVEKVRDDGPSPDWTSRRVGCTDLAGKLT